MFIKGIYKVKSIQVMSMVATPQPQALPSVTTKDLANFYNENFLLIPDGYLSGIMGK
jgi:hypothetical protein